MYLESVRARLLELPHSGHRLVNLATAVRADGHRQVPGTRSAPAMRTDRPGCSEFDQFTGNSWPLVLDTETLGPSGKSELLAEEASMAQDHSAVLLAKPPEHWFDSRDFIRRKSSLTLTPWSARTSVSRRA